MRDVKCIFLDIDGTVDNKDKVTTKYTKNVLGQLALKDIFTIICSGRMASYAISKSRRANCSSLVIADNGSLVYDYLNKKVIFESVFPKDILSEVGEICKANKVECLFNIKDGCYRYTDYNYHKYKRGKTIKNINRIKKNVTQIIISSTSHDDLVKVRDMILALGNVQVSNTNLDKELTSGKSYYCDLNILGNSKGKAIKQLIKYLNIDEKSTLCFGDSLNDLSMFEACYFKVAMKNASKELKDIATFVTEEDNDHDGVAKFIKDKLL